MGDDGRGPQRTDAELLGVQQFGVRRAAPLVVLLSTRHSVALVEGIRVCERGDNDVVQGPVGQLSRGKSTTSRLKSRPLQRGLEVVEREIPSPRGTHAEEEARPKRRRAAGRRVSRSMGKEVPVRARRGPPKDAMSPGYGSNGGARARGNKRPAWGRFHDVYRNRNPRILEKRE